MHIPAALRHALSSLEFIAAWIAFGRTSLSIIRLTIDRFGRHNGSTLAGAIAYFTLLSIFPLVLGLVALSGAILGSSNGRDQFIHAVAAQFPGSSALITGTLQSIIRSSDAAGIVATLGLIWSASGVFGVLSQALDLIIGARQPRTFIASSAVALALVFGVGLLFIASLALSTTLRIAFEAQLPLDGFSLSQVPLLYPLVGTLLPLLVALLAFSCLYRFVPSIPSPWRQIWPGAALAAVSFEIAKQAFALYLSVIADFNAVYGSIGAVIVLLTWAYIAAIVTLLGAEFNVARSSPQLEEKTPQKPA